MKVSLPERPWPPRLQGTVRAVKSPPGAFWAYAQAGALDNSASRPRLFFMRPSQTGAASGERDFR